MDGRSIDKNLVTQYVLMGLISSEEGNNLHKMLDSKYEDDIQLAQMIIDARYPEFLELRVPSSKHIIKKLKE